MSMDKSRTLNELAVEFVSRFNEPYFQAISYHLGSFVKDGFLKDLFEKTPSTPVDKAQLLIERFGKSANPKNFSAQAPATNIQPTTLSLIFYIALYVWSKSWDNFVANFFLKFGDTGDEFDDMCSSDDDSQLGHDTADFIHSPLVTVSVDKELKWCRHSIPNLKKAQFNPKAKNTLNKNKSGKTGKVSDSNQLKKKDKVPSSSPNKKNNNQLKAPRAQKKAKNSSKSKEREKGNQEVLAEILSLLRKLFF
ncbi:hypothetical protein RhiirA4_430840 [Rhizophagus irregularis]|uniref:Uncharacterized protein n=1 Tax=Rhizophagus irregularis TaxID=588596 RepID=A0A2I1HMG2_9GLOM|nr:hypothetical protein RhiirA4_430840 [Rhizophagus irregularis]